MPLDLRLPYGRNCAREARNSGPEAQGEELVPSLDSMPRTGCPVRIPASAERDMTSGLTPCGMTESADPEAAVALIRTTGDEPQILVLRRAVNPLDPWSGHFALPGGRREAGDQDLLDTCIRETWEETGIRLVAGELRQALPWACAGGRRRPTLVAPFLFEIEGPRETTLALHEIAEAHWLPLRYLGDPANHTQEPMVQSLPDRLFPCIRVGTGAIWGFTYGLLRDLVLLRSVP